MCATHRNHLHSHNAIVKFLYVCILFFPFLFVCDDPPAVSMRQPMVTTRPSPPHLNFITLPCKSLPPPSLLPLTLTILTTTTYDDDGSANDQHQQRSHNHNHNHLDRTNTHGQATMTMTQCVWPVPRQYINVDNNATCLHDDNASMTKTTAMPCPWQVPRPDDDDSSVSMPEPQGVRRAQPRRMAKPQQQQHNVHGQFHEDNDKCQHARPHQSTMMMMTAPALRLYDDASTTKVMATMAG